MLCVKEHSCAPSPGSGRAELERAGVWRMRIGIPVALLAAGLAVLPAGGRADSAGWDSWLLHEDGGRSLREVCAMDGWRPVRVKEPFRGGERGAWLRADVEIPPRIGGAPVDGRAVGLRLNSDFGGEIYVNGRLQSRYDNDHAGMALLSRSARPGQKVSVAVRVFRDVQDAAREQSLGEAAFAIVEDGRARQRTLIRVDASVHGERLPEALIGLSQGAGLPDYSDAIAARLRQIGVRWFRMDNILTNAVRREADGTLNYDWSDLDRRLQFMEKLGCEFIACASYMPQALEAFADPDRHAPPADFALWEELCYRAARHARESGRRIRYWEVWNEANSGWLKAAPGLTPLETYLKLYDATWKGVRRADPDALVGGPCNASGPWDTSPERSYAVNGESYMRGLLQHCEKTGAPLDFISWHEYFHPPDIFREEAEVTRQYLKDYPRTSRGVRELMVTEWNYAWWHDWAHDNEVGAAWMVNSLLRGMLPAGIAKPCFFLAMDFGGSDEFKGEWGMLLGSGRPKAMFNAARLVAMLPRRRIPCALDDPELAVLAASDEACGRTAVLLVNFAERYGVERRVRLRMENLDERLRGGRVRVWTVDRERSNAFHDRARAELECVLEREGPAGRVLLEDLALPSNSVTLVELLPPADAQ